MPSMPQNRQLATAFCVIMTVLLVVAVLVFHGLLFSYDVIMFFFILNLFIMPVTVHVCLCCPPRIPDIRQRHLGDIIRRELIELGLSALLTRLLLMFESTRNPNIIIIVLGGVWNLLLFMPRVRSRRSVWIMVSTVFVVSIGIAISAPHPHHAKTFTRDMCTREDSKPWLVARLCDASMNFCRALFVPEALKKLPCHHPNINSITFDGHVECMLYDLWRKARADGRDFATFCHDEVEMRVSGDISRQLQKEMLQKGFVEWFSTWLFLIPMPLKRFNVSLTLDGSEGWRIIVSEDSVGAKQH
jgi:hypothetical protein